MTLPFKKTSMSFQSNLWYTILPMTDHSNILNQLKALHERISKTITILEGGKVGNGRRGRRAKSFRTVTGRKPRRRLSAAARRKISAAAKARWAKAKRAGKTSLAI